MSCFAKQDPMNRGRLEGRRAPAAAFLLSACLYSAWPVAAAPQSPARAHDLSAPPSTIAATALPLRTGGAGVEAVGQAVEREITETAVPPGHERLVLAARLTRNGGFIIRPVHWRLYRLDEDGAPLLLKQARRPRQDLALPPGTYGVEVGYGLRKAWHVLNLRPGTSQRLIFILNVGGIRMLSTLHGVRQPLHGPVEYRVLRPAATGWRTVVRTRTPGQVLRLPAGRYRVESLFLNGNVKAGAEVVVKPGRLHSLHLQVKASLAEVYAPARHWELAAHDGSWRWRGSGAARLVLSPGRYVWRADGRERLITVRGGEHLRLR